MSVKTSEGKTEVSGTVYGKGEPRLVWVNGMSVDVVPQGHLLVSENYDKPGFIGSMTSLLGDKGVNIGLMHLGREKIGGRAIVFTNVDSPLSEELMSELSVLPYIISVRQVKF
jgi:D-3-phosphoglycerate dehydrogenase